MFGHFKMCGRERRHLSDSLGVTIIILLGPDVRAARIQVTSDGRRGHVPQKAAQYDGRDSMPPYCDVIDAACDAWQRLIAEPKTITSIGMREWAHVGQAP